MMKMRVASICSWHDSHAVAGICHGKQFGGILRWQADAAVRGGIAGEVSLMKAEVTAVESLEIRHARVVDRGGPGAVFVGDHKLTGGRSETFASG